MDVWVTWCYHNYDMHYRVTWCVTRVTWSVNVYRSVDKRLKNVQKSLNAHQNLISFHLSPKPRPTSLAIALDLPLIVIVVCNKFVCSASWLVFSDHSHVDGKIGVCFIVCLLCLGHFLCTENIWWMLCLQKDLVLSFPIISKYMYT